MALMENHSWRYHVFLSFRGEDTRNNFVGHLYKELTIKGIYTFKDDLTLGRGESIAPVLLEAIKESRFAIVIISEDYASSTWCLNELVKIMECRETIGQIVIPVFYNVDPSHVKNQRGVFGKAFAEHEQKEAKQKLQGWKKALAEVATISGWDSRDRDEATLIENIVRDISDKLIFALSSDASDLVGMGSHVKEMDRLLQVGWNVVHMVGIWGIPGIGKTTIARVVYNRLFRQFQASCFLENVKDNFKKHGEAALQKEFLSKILLERNLDIWSVDKHFNMIKERLRHKKILIVLDDVDKIDQLEALVKEPDWFGPGSRIIITTQDKYLLKAHDVHAIYDVKYLENDQALQLFSRYAFKQNQPKRDYFQLSNDFVLYAKGLPLALKVLGSSLYNRSTVEWQSELNKLRKHPDLNIQSVLKISYDGLQDPEKRVFLDIACFFNGENKEVVRDILDGCGFFPDRSFGVLIDRAMITISNNNLFVHELLQRMGWEIVRQESEELGERSRLWDSKDIHIVLTKNRGTKKVEGIFLDRSRAREMQLNSEAFTDMYNLRLLKFYNSQSFGSIYNVQLPEGLQSLSDELRYLYWHTYPSKTLPSNFSPENLVQLILPHSNVEHLWKGKQPVRNLKLIDLSHSKLTRIPDLSEAHKLERLNLQGCINLVEVSSIQYLTKLGYLDLRGCKSLRSLPSMNGLEFLRTLHLSDCSNLEEISQLPRNMKYLYLDGTAIKELPHSIGCLFGLLKLDLRNCTMLENLPISIRELKSLKTLNISGCLNLLKLLSGTEVPSSNGYFSADIHPGSLHSNSNSMEIPDEEEKEETGKEMGEERKEQWDYIRVEGCERQYPLEHKEAERFMEEMVAVGGSTDFMFPTPQVSTLLPLSKSLCEGRQVLHSVKRDLPNGVVEKTKPMYGLYFSSDNKLSQQVGFPQDLPFSSFTFEGSLSCPLITKKAEAKQLDSVLYKRRAHLSLTNVQSTSEIATCFEASKSGLHKIHCSKMPEHVLQDIYSGGRERQTKVVTEKVGKRKSKDKELTAEPPSDPFHGPKRMKSVDQGHKKAKKYKPPKPATTSTSVRVPSKRFAARKVAVLIKKRRLEGKLCGEACKLVEVNEGEDSKKIESKPKVLSDKDLQESCERVKTQEGKEKEASKEPVVPHEFSHLGLVVPEFHRSGDSFQTATQLMFPLSARQEPSSATQPPKGIASAPSLSLPTTKSPSSIFDEIALTLGSSAIHSSPCSSTSVSVTSLVTITSAKTQLKELLAMGLPDLVHTKRLKEMACIVTALEKGRTFLSMEQTSCLPLLKKLEEWGNSFQESEDHAAEATRKLVQMDKLKEELEKALNGFKQLTGEINAASAERAEACQQIKDTEKKLEGLQVLERSLSEKVEILYQKEKELSDAAHPLLIEYQLQNEDTIRASLTAAENNMAEMDKAYKDLQISFSSFS